MTEKLTMSIFDLIDPVRLTYNWERIESIPEFAKLKECKQSPKWHGEGDAFIHTKIVCESVVELIKTRCQGDTIYFNTVLMTAALFHDIGKGTTTFFKAKDHSWHAYGHEFESEKMVKVMLADEDPSLVDAVSKLVRYHMEPLDIKKTKAKIQKVFELAHKVMSQQPEFGKLCPDYFSNFRMLLLLKIADVMGSKQENDESKADDINFLNHLISFSDCTGIGERFHYDYSYLL